MYLTGGRVALGADNAARCGIEIENSRILGLNDESAIRRHRTVLDTNGYLALPGLINAHDHLEFNLYPRLGQGPYPNATAWARDIYKPAESPVREHLAVPKSTRLFWGGLKNLACGVTLACHHNPCSPAVLGRGFPIRVLRRFGWAHSLEFSPDLVERHRRTPPEWPFMLHLGEATDPGGWREIFRLDALGALDHRTVLVHAVALCEEGVELARKRGASLVWCPSSNLFLLGRTLGKDIFRAGFEIALGNDSALTAEGDLLDEFRVAHEISGLAPSRLYDMVTVAAARVLRLSDDAGTLQPGAVADVVLVRDSGHTPAESLLSGSAPELVIVAGRIKLASRALAAQLPQRLRARMSLLCVEGRAPVFVETDLPRLYSAAVRVLGPEVRLAGRKVGA